MAEINKGIACRVCKNNEEGKCTQGYTEAVQRKEECWLYANKHSDKGLLEHSYVKPGWS